MKKRVPVDCDEESGFFTVPMAMIMVVLLLVMGLVVDGAANIRGHQRANAIAEEAARVAGQQVDEGHAQSTGQIRVNKNQAAAAARKYLRAAGVQGTVTFPGQSRIQIVVTEKVQPKVLTMFMKEMTVTGQAQADLITRVEG